MRLLNIKITWVLRIILIIFLVNTLLKQSYLFALATAVAIFLSFVPSIVERNLKVAIPWYIEFIITFALLLHIISLNFGLFWNITFWSSIMHFLGTAIIALLAFLTVYTLNFTGKIKLNLFSIAFFTFIFAIAIGALWEIGEFYSDIYLGTQNQIGGVIDTMYDLIYDAVAGLIVAIGGILYIKYLPKKANGIVKEMVKKRK